MDGGPIYADAAHALQAAKLGHGVALGDRVLEADDFRVGTLVRPFELEVPMEPIGLSRLTSSFSAALRMTLPSGSPLS